MNRILFVLTLIVVLLPSCALSLGESLSPTPYPPTSTSIPFFVTPTPPTETPTAIATAKPTATLTPTPTESVSADFWEALKTYEYGGADWSKYMKWDKRDDKWVFSYAVDGTAIHNNVPIPGLEGVVADLAVKAYYYDINGNKQTILVAIVIRLPDGTLIYTGSLNDPDSRAELDQAMKDYTGAFQIGRLGAMPGAQIFMEKDLIALYKKELPGVQITTIDDIIALHTSGQLEFPGLQAYAQFLKANQAALEEFIRTGLPPLEIILPFGLRGSGIRNIPLPPTPPLSESPQLPLLPPPRPRTTRRDPLDQWAWNATHGSTKRNSSNGLYN